MKKSLILLLFLVFCAWGRSGVNILEININNDDLEMEYARVKAFSRNSQTFIGAGFLKSYDDDDIENIIYYATLT